MKSLYRKSDFLRLRKIDASLKNCPDYRSPFRRDYARLVHSPSFRRLQGKTQLFPGIESDFFRNRLTHSFEVAQIAKSIALLLNKTQSFLGGSSRCLDYDLVEFAGLAHDLGHPPFGHNGEKALNICMRDCGGFEGNAQTFRLLTKIEKKEKLGGSAFGIGEKGKDLRLGLNLTSRTLASILKYDSQIPEKGADGTVKKGYYWFDHDIVRWIKRNVAGREDLEGFRTTECYIMDVADDIAYSTYDLEDAFKANFVTPYDLITVNENLGGQILNKLAHKKELGIQTLNDVKSVLYEIVGGIFYEQIDTHISNHGKGQPKSPEDYIELLTSSYLSSKYLSSDGYLRVNFTSLLVDRFLSGIELYPNPEIPALSKVALNEQTRRQVEVLKEFAYVSLINSSFLKVSEFRGGEIVANIFEILSSDGRDGYLLLPEDFRAMYKSIEECHRKRIVCDFIAGMTDRYAIEFYGRLRSEHPETIFKPL